MNEKVILGTKLDQEKVFNKEGSDHLYQETQLTANVDIGTYNLRCQGVETHIDEKTGKQIPTNNAYNQKELDPQYIARLSNQAKELANHIANNEKLGVIALQEVPHDEKQRGHFINAVKEALAEKKIDPESWNLASLYRQNNDSSIKENNFGLLTIYKKDIVEGTPKEANFEDTRLGVELGNQKGRVLAHDFVFKTEGGGEQVRTVNVHFKGGKSVKSDEVKDTITSILKQTPGQCVVVGDTNQNVATIATEYTAYSQKTGTSISYSPGNDNKRNLDGFFFKDHPTKHNFKNDPKWIKTTSTVNTTTPQILQTTSIVEHFTAKPGYTVTRKENGHGLIIENATKGSKIEVSKLANGNLQFMANNNDPETLKDLSEAVVKGIPKNATIKIEMEGNAPKEEKEKAYNQLWLAAVRNGFEVDGKNPDSTFLKEHANELPPKYKNLLEQDQAEKQTPTPH